MPVEESVTCPIGGEQFTYVTTASYSTFGARPDGKPFGSWRFPLDMPICPSNGLVLYREFTAEELAKLTPAIATDAYRGLAAETQYYRAAWLEEQLAPGTEIVAGLLLQASWESDEQPTRKARYQREMIAAEAEVRHGSETQQWFWRARIINAWRELGEFDKASALLTALDLASLRPSTPPAAEQDGKLNERGKAYYLKFFTRLKAVIARRDMSAEPADMMARD
jgi:hypothetical protein